MNKLSLIIIGIFFSCVLFAQTNIDSLWRVWHNKSQLDTNRLQAIHDISVKTYLFAKPDSAYYFAQLQYDFANNVNQKNWMADALKTQGISFALRSDFDKATVYLSRSLNLYEETGDKNGLASIYNAFGNIFRDQAMFDQALKKYKKSIDIYEEIGDKNGLANVLRNMGMIFFDQGEYSQALDFYDKSLMLFEETKNQKGIADVVGTIGRLHEWQNDLDKAIEYYNKSLKIYQSFGDKFRIANMLIQIGNVYTGKEEYEKALDYYEKGMQINKEIDSKTGIASALFNIGIVCEFKGMFEEALDYTNKSIDICREINYIQLEISGFGQIGSVLYEQGKFDQAIYYGQITLKKAREFGIAQQVMNSTEILYKSYKALGNYKKALAMHEIYTDMNDSILSESKQREVIRQEYKFEYAKAALADSLKQVEKDHLMELTHKAELRKKNQTRNALVIIGFVVLLVAGGLLSRVRYIRRANALLESEKERAERSEQFKQQFLANMSHEIRTPMTAVLGMTNLTLETSITQKQRNYLEAIQKSSENLLVIINDILDLSKLEAGKMVLERIPFHLRDQVEQVFDTLRFKAEEKGLHFIIKIKDDLPDAVIGDPARLNQVLMNLCGNAIKFTEKGSVTISVEKASESPFAIRFSIIDTGIGIPEDKLHLLFEAFQQLDASTSRQYGGTGLGLSISKNLVELQNGKMDAKSTPGKGSVFSFTIPYQIATEEQITELKKGHHTDERALEGIRILLAEDNEYNRIVVNDTLENMIKDVTIDTAENGKIAIRLLEQNDYDLILMDANMPEMDGLEATRYIRKNFEGKKREISIIALTASVLNADIQNCIEAGMNAYVPKPFKKEELIFTLVRFYQNKQAIQNTGLSEDEKPGIHSRKKTKDDENNLNLTNLDFLNEFCEGDGKRMIKYIDMYLKATPPNLEKINAAFEKKDYSSLKIIIHSMKPHFNFMGMNQVRDLADQIEKIISEKNDLEKLDVLIKNLNQFCAISFQELT